VKRAMQLKARMKRVAREQGISAQLALQNHLLERLLERISLSEYRGNFVLKGGLLISAMTGIGTRTTMDMDGTVLRMPVTAAAVRRMFRDICAVRIDDGVSFAVKGLEEIREGDAYGGLRLSLEASSPPMAVPLKVDLTTGDKITPREMPFDFPIWPGTRFIRVLAYNLETILAEKLETILARGDLNTRMRDFYDVHLLRRLHGRKIDWEILRQALPATARRRGTLPLLAKQGEIMPVIEASPIMAGRWKTYRRDFDYAKEIEFADVCRAIRTILNRILSAR
jgi:predicted nucleotidyltransferase component of viral defense system